MAWAGFDLSGQTALVTGATGGIGLEIAKALSASGAFVAVNGRDRARAEAAAGMLPSPGMALAFDVVNAEARETQIAALIAARGGLDILVNNVGLRDRRDIFAFSEAEVAALLAANLVAPFALARRAAADMMARGRGGRIINITSIAGPLARAGDAAYTMSKGGLEAVTRAMAAELGPHRITVNAVAPGYVATEANLEAYKSPEVAAWLARRTALGRWAEPAEIAGAVVFLASPAASYVTGATVFVDGGYVAHF